MENGLREENSKEWKVIQPNFRLINTNELNKLDQQSTGMTISPFKLKAHVRKHALKSHIN